MIETMKPHQPICHWVGSSAIVNWVSLKEPTWFIPWSVALPRVIIESQRVTFLRLAKSLMGDITPNHEDHIIFQHIKLLTSPLHVTMKSLSHDHGTKCPCVYHTRMIETFSNENACMVCMLHTMVDSIVISPWNFDHGTNGSHGQIALHHTHIHPMSWKGEWIPNIARKTTISHCTRHIWYWDKTILW